MPFTSAQQEYWMMINQPDLWREWVRKYGHHEGFKALVARKRRQKPKEDSKRRRGKKGTKRKTTNQRRRRRKKKR